MSLKLSITDGGKEGKNKVITSSGNLQENFRKCSTNEGVDSARSVETLRVGLWTRTKQVRGKRDGEEETV